MSMLDIIVLLAYGSALICALVSKSDIEKVKWMLWAILILLLHIVGKVGP